MCLKMRALRFAYAQYELGTLNVKAPCKEPVGTICLFWFLSGAMWHHFCCVCP